ncbi:MAG: proline racemase family protein [Synergistaceae bacterium]|nr:proline racemase family protein [Synergistaceae bacterium]
MRNTQSIFTVDAHTTGTPIRVVTAGIPPLRGASVGEKMEYMKNNYDWIRTFLMQQPRGFLSLVGAVLTEPCSPDADYGLFYIDALTYQPMCGAGTFSVAKALVETGMVRRTEPETIIRLETPSGLVTVFVEIKNGDVQRISFENVPGFLYRKDLEINVPGIGNICVDVGFGGNFFTIVDIDSINMNISRDKMDELRKLSKIILASANDAIKVEHPVNKSINYMDQLLFVNNKPDEKGEYLCQCIFGDAQADISPCGTGTSTRLVQRYFRGKIALGETYYQKSIYGGVFSAVGERQIDLGGMPAVIPVISCSDVHITGFNHLIAEEDDKLKNGFISW